MVDAPKVTNEDQNVQIDDDYSKAFTDLAKMSDTPASQLTTAVKKPDAVATPAVGDDKAAQEAADKAAADAEAEKVAQEAADKAAADAAAAAGEGDLPSPEAVIAANEAKAAADKAGKTAAEEPDRLTAALEKFADKLAKPAAVKEPEKPAPQPKPAFTQDEIPVIQNYLKEFPDIAKAEELIRRVEQRQVVAYMFSEFEKRITPIVELVDALAGRTFKQDLTTAVPEYSEATRSKVIEWVAKQPSYLQDAYNKVVEEGTVEEVTDLINRYKADVGELKPPATASKTAPELPTPTKKAVASLAPVGTKRTATASSAPSKDDYDGAFKEAAAAET